MQQPPQVRPPPPPIDEQKKKEIKELSNIANFISEKGLKFKSCLCHQRQVDYFRGDHFHQVVLAHKKEILKMFKEVKQITELESLQDSIKLGQLFADYRLLQPLERHPGYQEELKKKYPKHLIYPRPGTPPKMSEKGFYMWNIPKPQGKLALLLTLGFLIAVAIMCINIWPMWMKIAIWYFSFYALVILMGTIVLRLFVWLFLFHFGLDLWIFPNFFIDSYDIMDSFRPVISFEVRQDDAKMYVIRLVSAVSLIFLFYQLAQEPDNIENFAKFTGEGFDDMFNWGNDRFVLGKLPDAGNSTRRKKSARELFEEAIIGSDEEKEFKGEKGSEESDEKKEENPEQESTEDDSSKEEEEDKKGADEKKEEGNKNEEQSQQQQEQKKVDI